MDLCRVCLATVADGIQTATLFSTTYQQLNLCDMLNACTALLLDPNDGLPNLICANCLANLITAYDFRVQCHNTDQKLRDILQMAQPKLDAGEDAANTSAVKVERDGQQYGGDDGAGGEEHLIEELYDDPLDVIEEDDGVSTTNNNDEGDGAAADPVDNDEYRPDASDADSDDEDIPLKKLRGKRQSKSPASQVARPKRGKYKLKTPKVEKPQAEKVAAVTPPVITGPFRQTVLVPEVFPCTLCDLVFNKLYRLNAHMNTHAVSKKYFECDKCKVRFFSDHALARHRVKHGENMAEPLLKNEEFYLDRMCPHCPRKFRSEETYNDHQRMHEKAVLAAAEAELQLANGGGGGNFLCEQCPRVFNSKKLLLRHIQSHSGLSSSTRFECDQCERSFQREEQLVKHMLRHDQLKKHKCPDCDKIFTHIGTLKSHMRTHGVHTAFLCSECGKAFGNSGNLKTHMMRHSGEKPYECDQCFSRFPIKGDLRNHMKTHTGVRPATCDICGSSFTRQSTLNKHKLIHIGIRPYACEMCDMR